VLKVYLKTDLLNEILIFLLQNQVQTFCSLKCS
jgi:hypothetical protein